MKIKRRKRNFLITIFSTSDIAFLLLIFIMLVSLINYRKEVKIEYPEAKTALRTQAEKNLEVWVDKNGGIYINGDSADYLELEYRIADLYQNAPDTRVHIIADRSTPYEKINSILEVFQILQYRVVSFVVKTDE
ncbi:MAG: biopolymer transporter ExbD [Treponema sp.]|jgi:biopolymer transport protein ExbD|nr:biopolymer transporter ExbD [Treponema sp.]